MVYQAIGSYCAVLEVPQERRQHSIMPRRLFHYSTFFSLCDIKESDGNDLNLPLENDKSVWINRCNSAHYYIDCYIYVLNIACYILTVLFMIQYRRLVDLMPSFDPCVHCICVYKDTYIYTWLNINYILYIIRNKNLQFKWKHKRSRKIKRVMSNMRNTGSLTKPYNLSCSHCNNLRIGT